MRRIANFSPARPFRVARRVARSRTEAAGELVRVEFERARLERDIDQMQARAATAWRALDQMEARARNLLVQLGESGREET